MRLIDKIFVSPLVVILGFVAIAAKPELSHARFRRGWGYGPGPAVNWRGGYWFHGTYVGRAGWWWVVGPTWYFYTAPVYPYPPTTIQPVYVVQVEGAPQPPRAPAPSYYPNPAGSLQPAPPPMAMQMPAPPDASPAPIALASPLANPPANPPMKPAINSPAKSQAFSYYCAKSRNYYPLVAECPEGWIATPVKSPNQ